MQSDATPPDPIDSVAVEELTLDLDSLTLGEVAAAELASGQKIQALLRGSGTLTLLALFVRECRRTLAPGERRLSWYELANQPARAYLFSRSRRSPDGPPPKSSDSE